MERQVMRFRSSEGQLLVGLGYTAMLAIVVHSTAAMWSMSSSEGNSDARSARGATGTGIDPYLPTPELIRSQGYPAEVHYVTTDDGYILELHRLPYGRKASRYKTGRPAVYLHHCLLCSSSDWIMNSPDKALAYLLADAGYDVWLGNSRGNTYSERHTTLSPDDKIFWDFSWDEMSQHDLPATIDYILNATGSEDLYYVGFSMGTTIFFAMLSEHPEYAGKIRLMVALGPVAYVKHIKGPLGVMAPYVSKIELILRLLGIQRVLPGGDFLDFATTTFCKPSFPTASLCHNLLFRLTGSNDEQLNKDYLPAILAHTPAGTSVHTITQFLQGANSGRFAKYDHGATNIFRYGRTHPPEYNLSRATVPVALLHSDNDWLAPPADVERLNSELPNVVLVHKVAHLNFTHLDFLWAVDAHKLVYDHVMKALSLY